MHGIVFFYVLQVKEFKRVSVTNILILIIIFPTGLCATELTLGWVKTLSPSAIRRKEKIEQPERQINDSSLDGLFHTLKQASTLHFIISSPKPAHGTNDALHYVCTHKVAGYSIIAQTYGQRGRQTGMLIKYVIGHSFGGVCAITKWTVRCLNGWFLCSRLVMQLGTPWGCW